jgi:hypothetical protein
MRSFCATLYNTVTAAVSDIPDFSMFICRLRESKRDVLGRNGINSVDRKSMDNNPKYLIFFSHSKNLQKSLKLVTENED